jgi:hypothetical protein
MFLESVLFLVSVVFPKAGTKVSGIPLYFSLLSFTYFCVRGFFQARVDFLGRLVLLATIFLLCFIGFSYFLLGAQPLKAEAVGYLVAYFSFFAFWGGKYSKINAAVLYKLLFWSIVILSLYGYLQKIFGDYVVVIPGLTANYSEALSEDFLAQKNNMIWGLNYLKLTSTYQNGNLFGVNFLILVGLFVYLSKYFSVPRNANFVLIFSAPVFLLTASATVYFGFSLLVLSYIFTSSVTKRGLILFWVLFVLSLVFVFYSIYVENIFYDLILKRLIDRDYTAAGGRTDKLFYYFDLVREDFFLIFSGMLPAAIFYRYNESFPFSVLEIFGLSYFIFQFFLLFCFLRSVSSWSLRVPFLVYLMAATIDGAFWSPPTALNFYLLLGICSKINPPSTRGQV